MPEGYTQIGKILIIAGLIIAAIGGIMVFAPRLNLFRLPGDINISGKGWKIYFPVVSCIVISLLLTLISWIIKYFSGK
ncbi:DUF2905 domain-containing protein [Sedimentisphaera salicampi]|uniref:DUF2905 domain-containing protein n=1 Tax=Sedimentisphaera salicampi TaxID=1941349 RepID=A0A1W6LLW8_9BACT|nr:DUF2905 domain-containing protein [Sedimentisphaera salicampi]ARN56743.1 hypothetical protein STSP1_01133 [Sedimentisphaera salicampi]OXU15184.1 hypothetical protein SMSP1_01115 [Sedimentisphaera salicampi]